MADFLRTRAAPILVTLGVAFGWLASVRCAIPSLADSLRLLQSVTGAILLLGASVMTIYVMRLCFIRVQMCRLLLAMGQLIFLCCAAMVLADLEPDGSTFSFVWFILYSFVAAFLLQRTWKDAREP